MFERLFSKKKLATRSRVIKGGLSAMRGWSVQKTIFFFRKSFCITDRCVVQTFSQLFFARKKQTQEKRESGFTSLPEREAQVRIFVFHNNNKSTKNP